MMVDMVIPEYEETPPPIVRTQQSAESVAAGLRAAQHSEACQRTCAEAVAYAAADQTPDMAVEAAWEALKQMPFQCLDLLYTAEGWATLIEGLRLGLGLPGPVPRITVH